MGCLIGKYGSRRRYSPYVELDIERYPIVAGVSTIDGYSAHADEKGLVEFVIDVAD